MERCKKGEKLKEWKKRDYHWHKNFALPCSVQSGDVGESNENVGEVEEGVLTRETPCKMLPVKYNL